MGDRRWSDADRELVTNTLEREGTADGVLDALTADGWGHVGRVRAEVAEEIAQHLLSVAGKEGGLWAAVIARAHRTTPEAADG